MNIQETLNSREVTYGSFLTHSILSQSLKDVVKSHEKWNTLPDLSKEAIEMILHKISRVINGDPLYIDSWHDIAGYATLVEKELAIHQNHD